MPERLDCVRARGRSPARDRRKAAAAARATSSRRSRSTSSSSGTKGGCGMAVSSSTSELVQLDETLWEIPAERAPGHARAGADLRRRRAARGDRRRPLARAAPERRDAAGDRRRGARDAGHPPGLRLPGRRRRGDGAARRGRLAGRGRLRHQLRRAAARPARSRQQSSAKRREPLVHEISRAIPAGAGKHGPLAALPTASSTSCCARGPRALVEPRHRPRRRPRAHRVAGLPAGRRSGRRLGAGARARRRAARHARRRQPLHRAAARRPRLRPDAAAGLRPRRGPG